MESLRYALVDVVALAVIGIGVWNLHAKLLWRPLHIVVGVMVLLTAIFDNALMAMRIFTYVPAHISGWQVGIAPVEDFAYTLAAAVLMPTIWEKLLRRP